MAQEVPGDLLGDEWTGYIFHITQAGHNDKQGFPTKQGVLLLYRVTCYPLIRKSQVQDLCGCIVGPDTSVLLLVIVERGKSEIPGLTVTVLPKRLVYQGVSVASVRDYLYVVCFVADPRFSISLPPSASSAAATSVRSSVADSNTRRSIRVFI